MIKWPKECHEKKRQYYADLKARLNQLDESQANVAGVILQETMGDHLSSERSRRIELVLWRPETLHIHDIFSNGDYRVLEFLLGEGNAVIFKSMWDRATDYPYSRGSSRRSYRSSEESWVHLRQNIHRLHYALQLIAHGFSWQPDVIVSEAANHFYLHDYIAYELDRGNSELSARLREIVIGDNNNGMLTRNMIKGLLMSHQLDAHRLVGDLLTAARLQEGLRQTIAESMDEASREGFIYMLKVIVDQEMWRFSSIVRAFDVWTGLPLEAAKPAVLKKCLTAAYDCLTNPSMCRRYLDSEDSQLLYIALWATAFEELADTKREILALAQSDSKYRKIVGLQFLAQCQAPDFQHEAAVRFIDDSEIDVAGWAIPNLYPHIQSYYFYNGEIEISGELQGSPENWMLFHRLLDILAGLPGKGYTIESHGAFPDLPLTAELIFDRLFAIIYDCGDWKMRDILLDYREKMSSDIRIALLRLARKGPIQENWRQALFAMLGDKSTTVRRMARETVEQLELTDAEYLGMEELLQYKAGDIRQTAIALLQKQSPEAYLATVRRLLTDKKEDKRLGGLDLVLSLQANTEMHSLYADCVLAVKAMAHTTARENVLIEQIIGENKAYYGPENGYGLYDPSQKPQLQEPDLPASFGLNRIIRTDPAKLQAILEEWNQLIEQYKDYEYETEHIDGSRETRVIGTLVWGLIPLTYKGPFERRTLDDYPLAEVWRTLARRQELDVPRLLELLYYFQTSEQREYEVTLKKCLSAFLIPTVEQWFDSSRVEQFERMSSRMPYQRVIRHLLGILLEECDPNERFLYLYPAMAEICDSLKPAIEEYHEPESFEEVAFPDLAYEYRHPDKIMFPDVVMTREIRFWWEKLTDVYQENERTFEAGFALLYGLARIHERKAAEILNLQAFAKALESGMIDVNEISMELMGRHAGVQHFLDMTRDRVQKELAVYPKIQCVIETVIQRVIEIELKRGDSDTPVSRLAQKIDRYEGMRHMVQCLLGLGGNDSLARRYFYSWGSTTKKEMISHLLKSCHPAAGENAETLRNLLKGHDISENRLIDVAMYAPQWVGIIEDYLEWPGLSSVCWYFHAHVNETFSGEKETMVGRYSPISAADLNEGAFDIDWFLDAYRTIGEEKFRLVYESAKYISNGANHRRSQLFADAALGRLGDAELESELSTKRNKNHVLCYGLIPLPEVGRTEALIHRYEVLQKFAKDSKQYGAQRRESESKVVRLALENLARNAGFPDVTRMTWKVEADQFKQRSGDFTPKTIEQWQIALSVDELGKASLVVFKDGKPVKGIPDKLKKDKTVLQLKESQAVLRDQHRRAREALEKAMVMQESFTFGELRTIRENPVIAPLIRSLVFQSGETLGYFDDGGLRSLGGTIAIYAEDDAAWIAHPVQLYGSGQWAAYQRDLISRQVVQPFKQVFRELYSPNEDERLQGTSSRRYAGHQIQPRKAAALFKSRQWTVSHEEGLQKVFHRQNIIATMFAMADWFSPAEVEAPTIEAVAFFDRRSGKSLHVTDIPPVIFSEVMRDIDLVVSVAHVGGVDPEASLSTVEMRAALVRELLPLLKLSNVEIKGSHAHIAGSLGEYTVHLGSGVVHRMAGGALHIIPVHSQHRGRIFLPFVDEDLRTAEIMSKVIVLAEDHKLKDPAILAQLEVN